MRRAYTGWAGCASPETPTAGPRGKRGGSGADGGHWEKAGVGAERGLSRADTGRAGLVVDRAPPPTPPPMAWVVCPLGAQKDLPNAK